MVFGGQLIEASPSMRDEHYKRELRLCMGGGFPLKRDGSRWPTFHEGKPLRAAPWVCSDAHCKRVATSLGVRLNGNPTAKKAAFFVETVFFVEIGSAHSALKAMPALSATSVRLKGMSSTRTPRSGR